MLCPEIFAGEDFAESESVPAGPGLVLGAGKGTEGTPETPGTEERNEEKLAKVVESAPVEQRTSGGEALLLGSIPIAQQPQNTLPKSSAPNAECATVTAHSAPTHESREQKAESRNAEGGEGLPAEMVEQLGLALKDNYVPAVKWFVKEKWLAASGPEPTTAPEAAAWLEANLPKLPKLKAERILKQRKSFILAIGGTV
jgi:hypothetical protein